MSMVFFTIVTWNDTYTWEASLEARHAYLHCEQSALSTIVMAISDNRLSATANTESPADLWSHLKDKYDVPAEETVYALIMEYHVVRMRGNETISCYAHQETSM